MRERLILLRERRQQLIERAGGEREVLGRMIVRDDAPSRWMETGIAAGAFLRQHPLWIAGALGLVFLLRPRRMLALAMKGFSLYQLFRRGMVLWARVAPLVMAMRRS